MEDTDEAQRHRPGVGGLEHGGERAVVHRGEPDATDRHRCWQQELPVSAELRIDPLRRERGDAEEVEAGVKGEHVRRRQQAQRRVGPVEPCQRHADHYLREA